MSDASISPSISLSQARSILDRLLSQPAHQLPPICLWGAHGIGKTELIESIAHDRDWSCVRISPAQFEEMGDLLGMPYLQTTATGKNTAFAPPDWVPQQAGPGILLLDDFNRADERILRGVMGLLQERRLSSWALPDDWYLLLTANPEGQQYMVTPVDEAVLTRMLHLQLAFDLDSWCAWARAQSLPESGVTFAIIHPQCLTGGSRSSARTFTFFLQQWQQLGQPLPPDPVVEQLAYACLDPADAHLLLQHLVIPRQPLPSTALLFDATQHTQLRQQLQQWTNAQPARLDLVGAFANTIKNHLEKHPELSSDQLRALLDGLRLPEWPRENLLLLLRDINALSHPASVAILSDSTLTRLLLT